MSDPTSSPDAPSPDDARTGWYWVPVVLLTLGIGSIVMLIGSNWIRERLMSEDINLVRAVGQVQTRTAIAHLWVEELVTGDDVDRSEIDDHLRVSHELIRQILAGDEDATVRRILGGTPALSMNERALRAQQGLIAFDKISRRRRSGYDAGEDVGIGSAIDVRYDAVFHELLDDLRYLEGVLETRLSRAEQRSRMLFRTIMTAWVLIVGLAVSGIWNRERRRQEAEMALRESEAQLMQAQKMEAVGRLAGGIAHDINNHLAAMTAQCELVKMNSEPDDPRVERMDAVITTATRSSELIKRLLAFSRRQPVLPETVNVNNILEGTMAMLRGLIGEDVALRTEMGDELWNVKIDPSQLEQVLLNLVVNARDAMPMGGSLTIATENRTVNPGPSHLGVFVEGGEYVVIRVADTGTGIPKELREKIFEPFYTTKERVHGSGLGLATVHGVVKQNHGHIQLDTQPAQGTTFEILLPRTTGAVSHTSQEQRSAIAPAATAVVILLVEDNEDLRESTREILETIGYRVAAAANAEEALVMFKERGDEIDLVITDVIMPGIDGKQLSDRLRQERPGLRVVFMSGYTDDVILHRGITRGEVNFVPKPFSAAQLAAKVKEVLSREPGTGADFEPVGDPVPPAKASGGNS